jgi:hypothetical protein
MKVEAIGEIYTMNLCQTTPEGKEPISEISLSLHFKAIDYPELIDLDREEVQRLFDAKKDEYGIFGNTSIRNTTSILRGTFNISFLEAFKFTGEKFTSGTVSMVKDIGAVIKLHVKLKYSPALITWIVANFRKMMNINITEVNHQMEIPQPKKLEDQE